MTYASASQLWARKQRAAKVLARNDCVMTMPQQIQPPYRLTANRVVAQRTRPLLARAAAAFRFETRPRHAGTRACTKCPPEPKRGCPLLSSFGGCSILEMSSSPLHPPPSWLSPDHRSRGEISRRSSGAGGRGGGCRREAATGQRARCGCTGRCCP